MAPKKSSSSKDSSSSDSELDAPVDVARFEQDMQELEALVETLEQGDLRLEDSLKLFERGTVLARNCKVSLEAAQLKVRNLITDGDQDNELETSGS